MKGPLLLEWRRGLEPLLLEWRGDSAELGDAAIGGATAAGGEGEAAPIAQADAVSARAAGAAPSDEAREVAAPAFVRAPRRGRGQGAREPAPPADDGRTDGRRRTPRGAAEDVSRRLQGGDDGRSSSGRPEPEFDPPPPARPDPGPPPLAYPRVQNPRALFGTGRVMKGAPATPIAEQPSHDLLIVPKNSGFRAADHGIRAVISYLHTTQMLTPTAERLEGDDLVVTLSPGPFAHLLFTEGTAPPGSPVVLEGALFAGASSRPLPWGEPERRACFWLALMGARFHAINDALRKRLHQILYLGPELVRGDHEPSRLSATARAAESARVQRVAFEEF